MKLQNLTNFVKSSKTSGVTFDDIKDNFPESDKEELERLLKAGLDLDFLKKSGRARGTRYYGFEFEVVQINAATIVQKVDENKFIDGVIDAGKCASVKEKIELVLKSSHPLSKPVSFAYRERMLDKQTNRELKDFLNDGVIDVEVKLHYSFDQKKNVIYSKQIKPAYNGIWIGKRDGILTVIKKFKDSDYLPEEKKFEKWIDFEKYLKTLLTDAKK